MDIIIIGGGPAAVESAVAARKADPEAKIAIFSSEKVLPYRRPALSGLLAAGKHIDEKTFYIKPAEFFHDQHIEINFGCRAVAIDGHEVIFASGNKVHFDKLILACGSNAVKPPLPGAENAYTLRSLDDMEKLSNKLDNGVRNAVIIGGGVLGLEIADSMLSRKICTTVIEVSNQLFPRNLSPADADALLKRLNALENLQIICGQPVSNISKDGVTLMDNRFYPADIVIMATGSRPDLTIPVSAGIECGKGIKVDEFMQSSHQDILAAGDMAEYNGRCFNLYMDAMASGKVAGANAAGSKAAFSAKFAPVRLMALGEKLCFD